MPKGLPLVPDHDHAIHLQPGSVPPNIRPYRYPYAQKSEIECMIQEMLEAGIIQPSQSSFSSSIVMVTKKDGSWCMCPDDRQLDKMTIKDKFPILVIHELLDELHGAIFFTKLDLRLEYLPKIAFRTHEGHYELSVMPFRLTNGWVQELGGRKSGKGMIKNAHSQERMCVLRNTHMFLYL